MKLKFLLGNNNNYNYYYDLNIFQTPSGMKLLPFDGLKSQFSLFLSSKTLPTVNHGQKNLNKNPL